MEENKVRIEDELGNIYYPHNKADVVFMSDGTTVEQHAGNKNNPHAVTKSQVGLGSVENYGVATQAEAEAGTANNKYMTPQRAKQAFNKNISPFSDSLEQLETQVTTHLDNHTVKSRKNFEGMSITDNDLSATDFSASITQIYNQLDEYTEYHLLCHGSLYPKVNAAITKKILDDTGINYDVSAGFALKMTKTRDIDVPNAIYIYPNNSTDIIYINLDNNTLTAHRLAKVTDIPVLNNTLTSSSTNQAATANTVKQLNDSKLNKSDVVEGVTTITPTAAQTPTSKVVSWSMSKIPIVLVTPDTSFPQTIRLSVTNRSVNGCTIWTYRDTGTTGVLVYYLAVTK